MTWQEPSTLSIAVALVPTNCYKVLIVLKILSVTFSSLIWKKFLSVTIFRFWVPWGWTKGSTITCSAYICQQISKHNLEKYNATFTRFSSILVYLETHKLQHSMPHESWDLLQAGMVAANSVLGKDSVILRDPRHMVPSLVETGARHIVTRFLEKYVSTGCLT